MASVVLFGGTGFLGGRIVEHLTTVWATVASRFAIPTRREASYAQPAYIRSPSLAPMCATKPQLLALAGANAVVNTISA